MTGLDLAVEEELSRSIEPCLNSIIADAVWSITCPQAGFHAPDDVRVPRYIGIPAPRQGGYTPYENVSGRDALGTHYAFLCLGEGAGKRLCTYLFQAFLPLSLDI
jgi:hypothetical protein